MTGRKTSQPGKERGEENPGHRVVDSISFLTRVDRENLPCLVVHSSVMPNERVGILLGQNVPRANLNARGEALPSIVWGDIVIDEYIDLFDEIHRF